MPKFICKYEDEEEKKKLQEGEKEELGAATCT
jgi:hypothetical protein